MDFLKSLYAHQDYDLSSCVTIKSSHEGSGLDYAIQKEQGIEWRLDLDHCTEYTFVQLEEELRQAGMVIESYEIKFGEFYGVVKNNNK